MDNLLIRIWGLKRKNNEELGSFDDSRVSCQPAAPTGDTVQIRYRGLLMDSGTDELFLHYAFDSWNTGLTTAKMGRSNNGEFEAVIQGAGNHEINFCFKDNADNWDNNSGSNWAFHF